VAIETYGNAKRGWLKSLLALPSGIPSHDTCRLWNQDTAETRYFLSSLSTNAQTFARYIRAHWGVENQLHWCLDVVFIEDASRIRKDHAPRNILHSAVWGALEIIRNLAQGGDSSSDKPE
jgi:hypothetical protein